MKNLLDDVLDAGSEPAHEHNDPHEISEPEAIRRFIFAGDATFTIQSEKTGKRYTYRVQQADPNPSYPNSRPAHFVKVLNGPDNTSDYAYLGMIVPSEPTIVRLTRASSHSFANGPAHKGLEWFLRLIADGKNLRQARFYHAGRCGRCNRVLTTPESVTRGIGPDCAEQMGIA